MERRMLLENVAMAKAILARRGITRESPEWADYQRIRDMCAGSPGWVGLLTRIRFVDGVDDFDELQSVLDVLASSGMDAGAMNRMTYAQILDKFHDQLVVKDGGGDYEVVVKDHLYTIYRVHTYQGILKVGSPAWCLKTRSDWDRYQASYPYQFVAVHNDWVGKLLSPESNYLGGYSNKARPWVRYGFSLGVKDGDCGLPIVFDDDNNDVRLERWEEQGIPSQKILDYVFHIFLTIVNVVRGVPVPGTAKMLGIRMTQPSNKKAFVMMLSQNEDNNRETIENLDMILPSSPFLQAYRDRLAPGDAFAYMYKYTKETAYFLVLFWFPLASSWRNGEGYIVPVLTYFGRGVQPSLAEVNMLSQAQMTMILDLYAGQDHPNTAGIRLERGLITQAQVEAMDDFVARIGDWLVFDESEPLRPGVPTPQYKALNAAPSRGFALPYSTLDSWGDMPHEPCLVVWINKKGIESEVPAWVADLKRGMAGAGLFTAESKDRRERERKRGMLDRLLGR